MVVLAQNLPRQRPLSISQKMGEQLLFQTLSHGCYTIDIRSSARMGNWTRKSDKRGVSSPYYAAGHFFASCGSRGVAKISDYQATVNENQNAQIKHTITRNAPYVPTSLVIDDFVFVLTDAGIASAIDLESGETLWKARMEGNFFASRNLRKNYLCMLN